MRRPYGLGAAAFVASLAIFLALAHVYGCARIGGLRHWVLHDDFMISERYARNLAQGRGLVFNPGERVKGFSDPLEYLVHGASWIAPLLVVGAAVFWKLRATPRYVGTIPVYARNDLLPQRWVVLRELLDR